MQQLSCVGPGEVAWREVPDPVLVEPTDALVRPVAVARCEIDPLLVLGGPVSEEGFALGHEAVAEVVAVGDEVDGLEPGTLVLPSFQVSCGSCAACRRGHSAVCDRYPVLSDYGMQPLSGTEYGGMLADLVRVPHARSMLTPLPPGIDPVAAASVPDNVLDGYRGVAPHLVAHPGADVLVAIHGNRSIGLYAAQAAIALGAGSVTVAEHVGATPLRTDFTDRVDRRAIVVDCGVRSEALQWAIRATDREGTLHCVSYYAAAPEVALPLGRLYTLGISFHIGRAHSASLLPEVAELVGAGRLHPEVVTSTVVDWDDAAARFLEPAVKLVVARPVAAAAA